MVRDRFCKAASKDIAGSSPVGGFMTENKTERKPLYTVERDDDSFRIFRKGYVDATVKIVDSVIKVSIAPHTEKDMFVGDFRGLKNVIISEVKGNWLRNEKDKHKKPNKKGADFIHKDFSEWLDKAFSKGLTYILFPEWKRLADKADPNILKIYKKFISVRGPKVQIPDILKIEATYKDEDFVKDALTYNSIHLCLEKASILNGKVCYEIRDPEHRGGYLNYGNRYHTMKTRNWRLLFSDCPTTYKALNKTLDNWPRGVPAHMAFYLANIHLSVPVSDRVKLIAILQAAQTIRYARQNHLNCIMKSEPEQIRKAFYIHKKNHERQHPYSKGKLNLRGSKSICNFISTTCDFPEPHHGGFIKLAEKSDEWHRTARWEFDLPKDLDTKDSLTKKPLIPLPEHKELRFLASMKEIRDEGREMGHCIASYAESAVSGSCFLFHCDYEEEKASIMLDKYGNVVQSFGPRNCTNKASQWASAELAKWGKKIAEMWNRVEETAEVF